MSGLKTDGRGWVNRSARPPLGSHARSHRGEQPSGIPDEDEQRAGTRPRSRTDLNGSGCPDIELRIRRSSQRLEGARVLAELRSGDGPLSVRVRPSSPKRDCARRATSTGGKAPVNVHAKSRLTLEPLRTLRPETRGQAGACPDRTRAIPCKVRRRAINVQLARVACGQSRILRVSPLGWSAASAGMICPIPKLIVRVRFPSPAPARKSQFRRYPACLAGDVAISRIGCRARYVPDGQSMSVSSALTRSLTAAAIILSRCAVRCW